MNWNFQPGIHPDADQLSVFVEGAATAREQQRMLAHLAECVACRKAVFLMQPHEEMQKASQMPGKGWVWRWLVPMGLPAAALACGLIAVLVYIRPHRIAPRIPQQIASVRPSETGQPGTTAARATNSGAAPTTNLERDVRSIRQQNGSLPNTTTNISRQQNALARSLSSPTLKNGQVTAGVTPQTTVAAASVPASTADAAEMSGAISTTTVSDLPLNGRNVSSLQKLQPMDTKAATSQSSLATKKDLPALEIERARLQNETLAGVSGRITDRSGAVISGVTVTLRDAAGQSRQTTTSANGSFHLTELPAGQYELTATAVGFQTSKQLIELKPSELAMLQPVLEVGTVSETVTVEAAPLQVQAESASVSAEMSTVGQAVAIPSGLPIAETVSHGKRVLSLDSAGNVFLSRSAGKKWKKIKPQWMGKAIRIELKSGAISEASPKPKNETSGAASDGVVFLLTTDGNAFWTSKDGVHWHQK